MRNQIVKFYNDADFQRLNSYYNRTTFFNIMNIERRELSHSAFLKWLFDINASHNLKDEPLKKLLRHLANSDTENDKSKNIFNNEVSNVLLTGDYKIKDFNIETEKAVEANSKGKIDIFAEFCIYKEKGINKNIVVIIENKVDSKHHDDQTKTYKEWAAKKFNDNITIPIYLSPNPDNEKDEVIDYFMISYQDILEYVIEPLLNMEMDVDTKILLEDYIVNLGQPKKQLDDNGKESDLETILAVSKKNKKTFSNLLVTYKDLLNASLVAKYNNSYLLKDIFEDELDNLKEKSEDNNNKSLLQSFWDANNMLLRMIFLYGDESIDENIGKLLKTNFSRPIQNFSFNENEYKGRGKLCHAIVADYIEKHPDATIEELRKAFDTGAKYKKNHVYFVDSVDNALKVINSQNVAGGNYYMKEDEQIHTKEGNVVVWGYWPNRFYINFENKIRELGYDFK